MNLKTVDTRWRIVQEAAEKRAVRNGVFLSTDLGHNLGTKNGTIERE